MINPVLMQIANKQEMYMMFADSLTNLIVYRYRYSPLETDIKMYRQSIPNNQAKVIHKSDPERVARRES